MNYGPDSENWIEGTVKTDAGQVPRVSTALRLADRLGAWRVRWSIGRGRYMIQAGLYAVGSPSSTSPVFVTANYKLSFDRLRSQLSGRDAWFLILDTRGINVWCAAGKGTFGTAELVARVGDVRLKEFVAHRKLILPQLGATGVSAHEVEAQTGFRVVFGPVRAADLPEFLDNGLRATPAMRRVNFPLRDRVALIPVELIGWGKLALLVAACLVLLSGIAGDGYSIDRVRTLGVTSALFVLCAVAIGATIFPVVLPWLPGRRFAVKGAWIGLLCVVVLMWLETVHTGLFTNWASAGAWVLFLPAATSFVGMNFTGASTFTSLSGVLKEMRTAVPVQIGLTVTSAGLWIVGLFV